MRKIILAANLVILSTVARADDWRQFRGNDTSGIARGNLVPVEFGNGKNIAWKVELPERGLSSPIIVGNRVFVTASGGPKGDRLQVLAFDAASGRRLWQRSIWATGPTDCHPKTCMAAPTPASDGRLVVALFATNDIVCVDVEGNVRWIRALYQEHPGASDGRGLATSPIIAAGTVIVHSENVNNPFAVGIDLESGANLWQTDRPRELCWNSPILLPGETADVPLVLLQGATRLSACDPRTGKEVWHLERQSDPVASSVADGRFLYVPGEKGLACFELQGKTPPRLLWERSRLSPETASPILSGGRLCIMRGPILLTADARTGDILGQLRLKGPFSSSPVAIGDLIFCVNESGQVQVVRPGDKESKLLATNPLGETILCTPAIADGAMYLRSDNHLWKIAK